MRQVLDMINEGIRQSMSRVQDTAPIQPILPVAEPTEKQETGSADSENYEIAEAFLKEMGL